MRLIILLLALLLFLSGCGGIGVRSEGLSGMSSFDGVSDAYPGARALSLFAAQELANRYPPARTLVALSKTNTPFGQDLEQALRAQGFSVMPDGSAGIPVAYTLDLIKDQVPATCYLQIKSPEGAFGTARPLSMLAYVEPAATRALESRGLDEPTVTSLPGQVSSSPAERPASPVEPLPSSAAATRKVKVRCKAQGYAKSYKLDVGDFCRWNHLQPDDRLTPGQTVIIAAQPHAVAAPAEASNHTKDRDPKPVEAKIPEQVQVLPPDVTAAKVKLISAENKPSAEAPKSEAPATDPTVRAALEDVAKAAPGLESKAEAIKAPSATAPAQVAEPASFKGAESAPAKRVESVQEPSAKNFKEDVKVEAGEQATRIVTKEFVVDGPESPVEIPAPWQIHPGSLRGQVQSWATRAQYTVVWRASRDLAMESSASFDGSFVDAIGHLFFSLHRSGHSFRVKVYQRSNVLEVTED